MPADDPDRRLRDVVRASGLLVGAADPREVVDGLLDAVIAIFQLEACSIGLLDPEGTHLRFAVSRGSARVREFEVDATLGIAGHVARTGQGVVSNDVARDPRFYAGVDQESGFQTRAILCAPLVHDGTVLGVIEAINPAAAQGFADDDLRLLTAIGPVAAAALQRARATVAMRGANAVLRAAVDERYHLVTGPSPTFQRVLDLVRRAAAAPATVLLLGESGTGKEVVARALHGWSARADGPFVAVNCTALTAELLESELFGHERGAFTGAIAQKKGKFELADGGTIFLDEIGDLAPGLQVKLLRVLQDREFQRVGGTKDIRVDVRIVAATNRELRTAVKTGAFREDLYYRLNVITVDLPPLRTRSEDVPALVEYFVERFCRETGRARLSLAPDVLPCLRAYDWPGNVRELQNVIERAVVLAPGPELLIDDLPLEVQVGGASSAPAAPVGDVTEIPDDLSLRAAIDVFTRVRIQQVLDASSGHQTEAARRLGLPQSNLSRLMKRLGLR